MAVIEGVPGIEVGVLVKNQPAQEYTDGDDKAGDDAKNDSGPTKQITRYIESITDAEFQISLSVNPRSRNPDTPLLFYLYIDGVQSFTKGYERGIWSYNVQGKRVGDWSAGKGGYQGFKFSRIETSSEERHKGNFQTDAKALNDIGVIRVDVHQAKRGEPRLHPKTNPNSGANFQAPSIVHEKAMKGEAKSHGVSLGNVTLSGKTFSSSSYKFVGKRESPMAVFIFKYRSKGSLKKLLVIRPTPEPDILEGLGDEERMKAERYIKELKNKTAQGSLDQKGVKRERAEDNQSQESRKKSKPDDQIEMVDLTDD